MINILNFYLCKGVGSINFTPLFYTQTILLPVVIQYIQVVACSHFKVSNCDHSHRICFNFSEIQFRFVLFTIGRISRDADLKVQTFSISWLEIRYLFYLFGLYICFLFSCCSTSFNPRPSAVYSLQFDHTHNFSFCRSNGFYTVY